ncbi:MAG: hypothetical protein FJ302_06240 [Planctomycetes bacterium]|nr:hypothetical protein [Planctomycetota bacterium]
MLMNVSRRDFLKETVLTTAAGWSLSISQALNAAETNAGGLHIAPFKFDVTPPLGHSCCGGWIKPIEVVDDTLEALGVVLLGAGKPIVLCAVDWTGLLNEAHVQWRTALAEAAGTTPDRVAVHCVHQHNAPFACLEAERLVAAEGDLPHIVDVEFFKRCLDAGRAAVTKTIKQATPVTHIGWGQGKVIDVASNRRVHRDESGKIIAMRGSSCSDPKLIALPEGLIDPFLKTVAFFDGEKKIASLHYYATHPMSYYADGRCTSDFAGLARKQRQQDEPNCLHIYFTGCAGNVSAGKYNDGSKAVRPILTKRVYDGIVASEAKLERAELKSEKLAWKTAEILPPPLKSLHAEKIAQQISTKTNAVVNRNRPSYQLSWLRRVEKRTPIVLSSLHLGGVKLLHLPAESFIEYQLRAQSFAKESFVCTSAYGDGGPWYIPVKEEYPNGGYEVSVAFCEPEIDDVLTEGMKRILPS